MATSVVPPPISMTMWPSALDIDARAERVATAVSSR